MPSTDPKIAILDHDGQGSPRLMPALRFLPQPSHRSQQLQLIEIALLPSIHLGEIVEGLVGKGHIGH